MPIVTEGMVKTAIALVRPAAQTMLKTKGLTWGPKFVEGSVRVRGLRVIDFCFGTVPGKWNPKWGEEMNFAKIASRKRRLAERGRANTSVIVTKPWTLLDGDYLYAGGVYRDGIAVGVSGAKSATDEAIAEMVVSTIVMLAHLETEKRIAAKQMQV